MQLYSWDITFELKIASSYFTSCIKLYVFHYQWPYLIHLYAQHSDKHLVDVQILFENEISPIPVPLNIAILSYPDMCQALFQMYKEMSKEQNIPVGNPQSHQETDT